MMCKCVRGLLSRGISPEEIALTTRTDPETVTEIIGTVTGGENDDGQ